MATTTTSHGERVAIVTGASKGLGLALARALAAQGWRLVLDARGGDALTRAGAELGNHTTVVAITGDVADEEHRTRLVAEAVRLGRLELLVNNASTLGPSPQPTLAEFPLSELRSVYEVNVLAPLRLVQLALPQLVAARGQVVNVTSDAAVEPYAGWGGYGSSKAALEQLSNVLAAEHPELRVLWVDPGDMRTDMHQAAFPGEDISDRPPAEASVPGLLALLGREGPSGRYRVEDVPDDLVAPSELVRR
jgi:NAD(P)-dependent dehydrogenase (short-subunit alcohol dehydrogenase family)